VGGIGFHIFSVLLSISVRVYELRDNGLVWWLFDDERDIFLACEWRSRSGGYEALEKLQSR